MHVVSTSYPEMASPRTQHPEQTWSQTQPLVKPWPGLSMSHGSWLLQRCMNGHPQPWPRSAWSSLQDSGLHPYYGHWNPQKDLLFTKSSILDAMLLHTAWCPWHLRQQATKADSTSTLIKTSKFGLKNPIQIYRTSHLHSARPTDKPVAATSTTDRGWEFHSTKAITLLYLG